MKLISQRSPRNRQYFLNAGCLLCEVGTICTPSPPPCTMKEVAVCSNVSANDTTSGHCYFQIDTNTCTQLYKPSPEATLGLFTNQVEKHVSD